MVGYQITEDEYEVQVWDSDDMNTSSLSIYLQHRHDLQTRMVTVASDNTVTS